jgi:hypothetical protein
MDLLLHGLVWLALVGTAAWLLSFWPRWIADDLGLPQKDMMLRPWMRGLAPYRTRWPVVSWDFWIHLWRRGRLLEFVLAAIAFFSAFRIASAFFKTASAVMRAAG